METKKRITANIGSGLNMAPGCIVGMHQRDCQQCPTILTQGSALDNVRNKMRARFSNPVNIFYGKIISIKNDSAEVELL